MPYPDACPNCGSERTVEVEAIVDFGVVCEASYFCARCKCHRADFSYGAWRGGTLEQPDDSTLPAVEAALQRLAQEPIGGRLTPRNMPEAA